MEARKNLPCFYLYRLTFDPFPYRAESTAQLIAEPVIMPQYMPCIKRPAFKKNTFVQSIKNIVDTNAQIKAQSTAFLRPRAFDSFAKNNKETMQPKK